MLMASNQQIQKAKFWHKTSLMEFKIHALKTNSECKTLTICLHYIDVLFKKIRDKRSENLILAIALHKSQHNVTSMQLKAVDVINVAVMTISSRTALLIEIMTKKTVVPTHGQQKHYNDYKSKSNDENSIEKSIQAVTDLLRSLLKQNKPSHTTFNKSTHRHSYTNKHSDHKPSYKHPNHRSDKSAIEGHLEPLYVARKFTFMHTEFISHHTKIRMITRQIADDINLIRSYLSTFTTG